MLTQKEVPFTQEILMSPPDKTLAEQFAQLQQQTADIRKLCKKQRRELAVQVDRLQDIRRAIRYVEKSLEKSRDEVWESRLLLELYSLHQTRSGRAG